MKKKTTEGQENSSPNLPEGKSDSLPPLGIPPARAPKMLSAIQRSVLHWVVVGDPFREKGRGDTGRKARIAVLNKLQAWGLVKCTKEGFWRPTAVGRDIDKT
jgi:hypothetical protein